MIKPIKDSYRDLFLFLKKPDDNPNSNQTLREKSLKLFSVLLLDLVIAGICVLFLSLLEKQGLFSTENHKIIEHLKTMPKSAVIIAFIIVIPLLEELIFRLYLRYKSNYLLRFFISFFYVLGKNRKERIERRIKKIWYKKYGYIFYFSAVLFGFVHVFNFDIDKNMLLLFPILTAPQIFGGVFSGYLRVRFNLIWGYFLHAVHNMILLLPFLFLGNATEVFKTDTKDYSIIIEEVFQSEGKKVAGFFPDSMYLQNYTLKDIIAITSNKDLFLIDANNEEKMNMALNYRYKNKSDSNFIDKQVIEKHLADLYQFETKKEQKSVNVWTLHIVDSLKLIQHRTDSIKGNYWGYSGDSATIHRVKLARIANAIQKSKMKNVFLKDNIAGRFNIRLKTTDTTDLRMQLDSIYGLQLVNSLATVEYLKVDFDDKK